jgi:hypothetical protein
LRNSLGNLKPKRRSWAQETPKASLEFIHSLGLKKAAKIIDEGEGTIGITIKI